jgi:transcription termination factor Rho
MYDVLQLNDLLVPELHDIALQLSLTGFDKLDKQTLIQQILDKQSIMNKNENPGGEEKPKRKRTLKSAAGKPVEAPAETLNNEEKSTEDKLTEKRKPKKRPLPVEEIPEEDLQPKTNEQSTIPAAIASLLKQEDEMELIQSEQPVVENINTAPVNRPPQYRKEPPAFNIEFEKL